MSPLSKSMKPVVNSSAKQRIQRLNFMSASAGNVIVAGNDSCLPAAA